MDQLAENNCHTSVTLHPCYSTVITRVSAGRAHWSHFSYSPVNTRVSAGREQLVTLLLLSIHHPWISWQSTAGHTSVTIHSSPVDQLADHSWSHFCYSPLITRGSAGRVQLVTLLLISTHHPWISWQSTAGHTSVTLQSSPVCQLAEHTGHTSVTLHSPPVCPLAEYSWLHFCYSPIITRASAGKAQLVRLLLLYTHHPWISWQSRAGHTSVTLHSSPVDHWQSRAGHTSVTLHSSPVDRLAKHSWSHFCYSTLFTRGSTGRAQLVTILLLSTHHQWITSGHTSATPLIIHGSAGRAQLVTLRLLFTHHPWINWQSTAGPT